MPEPRRHNDPPAHADICYHVCGLPGTRHERLQLSKNHCNLQHELHRQIHKSDSVCGSTLGVNIFNEFNLEPECTSVYDLDDLDSTDSTDSLDNIDGHV